jgi:vacuolar-type H+-ATPase subunit H
MNLMRDVIQKVIATEAEAKRMVEAAKAEADRILFDAKKQGDDLAARARQETRAEAENVMEAALQAAEQEKRQRLARVTVEIETQVRLDDTTRQRAVAGAVRCACGQR